MLSDAPLTLDERLATAMSTSNMIVSGGMIAGEHRRNGAMDVIGAAGLALKKNDLKRRIGIALIELMGEWGRCDKPRRANDAEIAARAVELRDKRGRPDKQRARKESMIIYERAMRERAAKLPGRAKVIGLMTIWAMRHDIDPDLISPAVFHYLSPGCPVCGTHGVFRRADAPVLGAKVCWHCNGSGTWARADAAWEVSRFITDCLGGAKSGIGEHYGR